jgi:hypothetical protein
MKRYAAAVAALFAMSLNAFADNSPAAAPAPASHTTPANTPEGVPQGGIEVMKFVLSSSVQDREPGPEITSAKVGDTVVAWSQIRSGLGEVTITHRWLHEAENAGDVALTVKSSPWRTWSRKTVDEPGNWKVQVLDPQGTVLKDISFTVAP